MTREVLSEGYEVVGNGAFWLKPSPASTDCLSRIIYQCYNLLLIAIYLATCLSGPGTLRGRDRSHAGISKGSQGCMGSDNLVSDRMLHGELLLFLA
jgi:hypothetical protein